jgi:hypothetical protein
VIDIDLGAGVRDVDMVVRGKVVQRHIFDLSHLQATHAPYNELCSGHRIKLGEGNIFH